MSGGLLITIKRCARLWTRTGCAMAGASRRATALSRLRLARTGTDQPIRHLTYIDSKEQIHAHIREHFPECLEDDTAASA